jgi:hypothetical protein
MFEFGENDKTAESSKGAEWSVDVPQDRAGQEHTVCAMLGAWGQPAALSVLTPGGQELLRREFAGGWTGTLVAVKLRLPEAGTYTVRYLQGGTGPKGGRIATAIYVIPASAGPPELE